MKYLPRRFREAQQDWFGKKGISWHMTVAVMKSSSELECIQNWWRVLLVLEAPSLELKARHLNIEKIYLRSDNAGCYHCAPLILSITDLSKDVNISISRYDFSEAQTGHVDPGETIYDAALRETTEEAGLLPEHLNIYKEISWTIQYQTKKAKTKEVVYWLAQMKDCCTPVVLSSEHQAYKWLGVAKASAIAKYRDTQGMLWEAEEYINK
ncbi:uncharacterized protein LOC110987942 isoform X2 [Acanthaster planci]|uniref:Bis(5'-nucleosyl)-tetraphosphatase [asymmetrical] n=1 Tax=Acanthaster planci TaxID=133434 RepID=A0A8B7ZP10_ACAPL|nr:uncharacterized protein LOC110987942 isoform X2 [Acanthaster planci]